MVQVMRLESECTKLVGEKDSLHTELLKADSEVVQLMWILSGLSSV